jgi:hypothetical protein
MQAADSLRGVIVAAAVFDLYTVSEQTPGDRPDIAQ